VYNVVILGVPITVAAWALAAAPTARDVSDDFNSCRRVIGHAGLLRQHAPTLA
jgi:hypothetical protein